MAKPSKPGQNAPEHKKNLEERIQQRLLDHFLQSVLQGDVSAILSEWIDDIFSAFSTQKHKSEKLRALGAKLANTPVSLEDLSRLHAGVMTAFLEDSALETIYDNIFSIAALLGELTAGYLEKRLAMLQEEHTRLLNNLERENRVFEDACLKSEKRFQVLAASSTTGIFEIDSEGKIIYFNQAWLKITGLAVDEVIDEHLVKIVHPDDLAYVIETWNQAISSGGHFSTECRLVNPAGNSTWISADASPLRDDAGQITSYIGTIVDISTRKLADQQLENMNDNLQRLARQLISAQEEERQRFAHFLHEEVLNQFAVMFLARDDQLTSDYIRYYYQQFSDNLRKTVQDLRPPMLNNGLFAALEGLVDELDERPHVPVTTLLEIPRTEIRFSPEVELHLFRIVQQACENAIRHAQADTIKVNGIISSDIVDLTIEDDGIGFEVGEEIDLGSLLTNKHFGLAGMLERAAVIDAQVSFHSKPGVGTRVMLKWKPEDSEPA